MYLVTVSSSGTELFIEAIKLFSKLPSCSSMGCFMLVSEFKILGFFGWQISDISP